MRIGLNDLDPQIAQALQDRLCAPVNEFLRESIYWGGLFPIRFSWQFHTGGLSVKRKREPNPDERSAYNLRKKREEQVAQRAIAAAFVPLGVGAGLGFGVQALAGDVAGAMAAASVWLTGTLAGTFWALRARPKARLERGLQLEEMRAVFPLLSLSRAERVYCDTLLLLARAEATPEVEGTMRETLRQINSLLHGSRELERKRLSLLPVLGTNSVWELEAELGKLASRLEETTDPVARQSLQQSLEMCTARLENARAFEQGLERLKIQEEAIVHTLSSALTALARIQLSPQPEMEVAAQEIATTVSHINQQTYAVEQAVQEVMNLRQP